MGEDRNGIEAKPTVEIGEQQLQRLLSEGKGDQDEDQDDDGGVAIDIPDPSPAEANPRLAHTLPRELERDRTDVVTIMMPRFRAPVASTIDPRSGQPERPTVVLAPVRGTRQDIQTAAEQPSSRKPPKHELAPALHRHGVVTMAPLSAADAPVGSSSQLQLPPSDPDPHASAYSYQPHLARIQRVAKQDEPGFAKPPASQAWEALFEPAQPSHEREARPPRMAKSSVPEAKQDAEDWVVLVTHRTTTEAVDPRDIVEAREAPRLPATGTGDGQPRLRLMTGLPEPDLKLDELTSDPSSVPTARIGEIAKLLAAADAQARALAAVKPAPAPATVPVPEPPTLIFVDDNLAIAAADAAPSDCRGIAPEGTRSVEVPILPHEPADSRHREPSIVIAVTPQPAYPPIPATPSERWMWPLEHAPEAETEAEQVIATLRDVIARDAVMPRNHGHAVTPLPTPRARQPVRPRHIFASFAVLSILLAALYALATVIF